ncbi:MAG: hypothetical protein V7742_21385 [Halioglobus sp.]
MAGFKGGRRGYKAPKQIGRGILEAISTEGPHTEWLGMKPYYIHTLTIEGIDYSYLSDDADLGIDIGKKTTFRHKDTKQGQMIEKRSLGVLIDPSEFNN